MIQELSHSLNLGISFLMRNNLKLVYTKDKVALMPVKYGSASRGRLVDGALSIGGQGKYGGQPKSRRY